MSRWTADNIPSQDGRLAVVTGANAGIGYEAARVLAHKGAQVILACRSQERGQAAVQRIEAESPKGSVALRLLDLSKLESVRDFAAAFVDEHKQLDLLINNAGVMVPPQSKTSDGFELQIGVNHLGHFALTGRLLPLLLATDKARVVTLSSLAHRGGRIDLDGFRGDKPYKAWREYEQSKLACLMFALELDRRLKAAGESLQSLAAHPGGTKTDLQRHSGMLQFAVNVFSMEPSQGALPTLYAATEPSAKGGDYIGPHGFYEITGYPKPAKVAKQAKNEAMNQKLWAYSVEATQVDFL